MSRNRPNHTPESERLSSVDTSPKTQNALSSMAKMSLAALLGGPVIMTGYYMGELDNIIEKRAQDEANRRLDAMKEPTIDILSTELEKASRDYYSAKRTEASAIAIIEASATAEEKQKLEGLLAGGLNEATLNSVEALFSPKLLDAVRKLIAWRENSIRAKAIHQAMSRAYVRAGGSPDEIQNMMNTVIQNEKWPNDHNMKVLLNALL